MLFVRLQDSLWIQLLSLSSNLQLTKMENTGKIPLKWHSANRSQLSNTQKHQHGVATGGSRTAATSKIELFLTTVYDCQQVINIFAMSFILDVAAALDSLLVSVT